MGTLAQYHILTYLKMNSTTCLILLLVCASALARVTSKGRALPAPPLDKYLTLAEADAYVDSVVETYPDIASIEVIGNTAEGRDIRALKLSTGGTNKKAVLIESLLHGREWVSLPAALNTISELVEGSSALLDTLDFLIIPVASPDSYEYSWQSASTRTWRKNREVIPGSTCIGVDPNRNFDAHFGEGGSADPCTDNYEGEVAGTAAETLALVNFFDANPNIAAYISLHSFGPAFVYPPGYSLTAPGDDAILRPIAEAAANAAQAAGATIYEYGTTAEVLGLKFGQSIDYAHETVKIPLTFTLELASGGPTGWDPPASAIAGIAAEAFAAIEVIASNVP